MNQGVVGYSILLLFLMAALIFGAYIIWINVRKEKRMKRHEIIFMKILFVFFVIIITIFPILFARVIYKERFRVARGSVAWDRHILPNSGDCDASCKAQCDKDDYRYIAGSNSTSCDCICLTFCRQCFICKNPPDDEVRTWVKRMER